MNGKNLRSNAAFKIYVFLKKNNLNQTLKIIKLKLLLLKFGNRDNKNSPSHRGLHG